MVGEDYTCSINGRLDPSVGLPGDVEQYDGDYGLELLSGSSTGLVFDPSTWMSTTSHSWKAPIRTT